MIRLGIISFAHMHADQYAACIQDIDGAELAGVWDDDPKRGRAAAKAHGTRFYKDIRDLLISGIDGAIVCSENARHREHVEAAAAANAWVLCEKPIATTAADAKSMIKACAVAKVGLGIAFPCRFSRPLAMARQTLQDGGIGNVLSVTCTNNGMFPGGWFADPGQSGGGAVMDHTVHVADALRWMTGSEFTDVYCALANRFHPEIEVDDVGSLQLRMANGVAVSHIASWNRPAGYPTWGDVTMEFVGTEGTLRVDAFNEKLAYYPDADKKSAWVGFGADANRALIQDFVDAVRERRAPAATGEDGLRALEVTLAAYRSANSGKVAGV